MTSQASSAASAHEDDEWNITYEHVNPQDPLIAAPRWRDALVRIKENAESWHGDDAAKGRALAVIAGWAKEALGE